MAAADPHAEPRRDRLAPLADAAVGIAGVALLLLVVVQGWQVVARYVLNDSPSWTEPVTLLLLSAAMSFGAAAGVHAGAHFRFGLLAEAASPRLRRLMEVTTQLVVVTIGGAVSVWSAQLFFDGLDVRMAGAALPQSANFAPLALGGLLIALFGCQHLLRLLGGDGERR